jgi:hypothetical protein
VVKRELNVHRCREQKERDPNDFAFSHQGIERRDGDRRGRNSDRGRDSSRGRDGRGGGGRDGRGRYREIFVVSLPVSLHTSITCIVGGAGRCPPAFLFSLGIILARLPRRIVIRAVIVWEASRAIKVR